MLLGRRHFWSNTHAGSLVYNYLRLLLEAVHWPAQSFPLNLPTHLVFLLFLCIGLVCEQVHWLVSASASPPSMEMGHMTSLEMAVAVASVVNPLAQC